MSISVTYKYGAFGPDRPVWIDQYGVLTPNKYGVITDPEPPTLGFLLAENGNYLVQENDGKILLS
jgi:hypothetical protein